MKGIPQQIVSCIQLPLCELTFPNTPYRYQALRYLWEYFVYSASFVDTSVICRHCMKVCYSKAFSSTVSCTLPRQYDRLLLKFPLTFCVKLDSVLPTCFLLLLYQWAHGQEKVKVWLSLLSPSAISPIL